MEPSASIKAQHKQMAPMTGFNPENQLRLFLEYFAQKPGFDRTIFTNLLEDTNEDTVIRILAHFNENLREGITRIGVALRGEECDEAWKTSHKIAGSAELLGFKPYAQRSRDLSRYIRANPVFAVHEDGIRLYLAETEELHRDITTAFPTLKTFL